MYNITSIFKRNIYRCTEVDVNHMHVQSLPHPAESEAPVIIVTGLPLSRRRTATLRSCIPQIVSLAAVQRRAAGVIDQLPVYAEHTIGACIHNSPRGRGAGIALVGLGPKARRAEAVAWLTEQSGIGVAVSGQVDIGGGGARVDGSREVGLR